MPDRTLGAWKPHLKAPSMSMGRWCAVFLLGNKPILGVCLGLDGFWVAAAVPSLTSSESETDTSHQRHLVLLWVRKYVTWTKEGLSP